jgi:peptidoglycan-N-acetylglucosamine deacetylase
MIRLLKAVSVALFMIGSLSRVAAADCADDPRTSGLTRTTAINSSSGDAFFGRLQYKNSSLLRMKEVVLTFDDGPHPTNTKVILDILDRHCVKATFFVVGRMALATPKMVKMIAARGHTVATHTWAHPKDLSKLPVEEAKLEIEKGFVAVAQTLGEPVAPFFRYPGLNHSAELDTYLSSREISVWSVDVVSNDTAPGMTPDILVRNTMDRLRKMGRGIVLFHDLKLVTAESLDSFLTQLRMEGFKVVHVVSNSAYRPNAMVAHLDLSKHTNERFDYSALEGDVTGDIDVMKTEFVHIETSAPKPEPKKPETPKQESQKKPEAAVQQEVAKSPDLMFTQ